MKPDLLDLVVCPSCGGKLELSNASWPAGEVEDGQLCCLSGDHVNSITQFIPRFIALNYGPRS